MNKSILITLLISVFLGLDCYPKGDAPNRIDIIYDKNRPYPTDTDTVVQVKYEDNGIITISFCCSEGSASLNVTNLNEGYTETVEFTTENPYSFYIGTTPGSYQIEIETETGGYYICLLKI